MLEHLEFYSLTWQVFAIHYCCTHSPTKSGHHELHVGRMDNSEKTPTAMQWRHITIGDISLASLAALSVLQSQSQVACPITENENPN